jgi:hypothetical protein
MKKCTFFFDDTSFPKQHHLCCKFRRFRPFALLLGGVLKTNLRMKYWCKIKLLEENSVTVPPCPARISHVKNQA